VVEHQRVGVVEGVAAPDEVRDVVLLVDVGRRQRHQLTRSGAAANLIRWPLRTQLPELCLLGPFRSPSNKAGSRNGGSYSPIGQALREAGTHNKVLRTVVAHEKAGAPTRRTPAIATTLRRGLFTTERSYVKPPCPSAHTSYSRYSSNVICLPCICRL
jgi:hypothetical protein